MSKAENNILGLQHGKIGDRIAVVLNGKQIYKKLYKPTNPQTPEQQKHRAKMAFVNKLAAVLKEAINLGYAKIPKAGSMQSPRNAFVHENFYNGAIVWDEEACEWGLVPERLKLADGPRYIARRMSAEVHDGKLYVHCPDTGIKDSHGTKDDQLMVAVYRPAVPTLHLLYGPMRNACSESVFDLPEEPKDEEDVLHVYAWFTATAYHRSSNKCEVQLYQASPSVYLGCFRR